VQALPCGGTFRVEVPDAPDVLAALVSIAREKAGGRVRIRLERGPVEAHAKCDELRPLPVRNVERRIVTALGGHERKWQADYL